MHSIRNVNIYTILFLMLTGIGYSQSRHSTKIYLKDQKNYAIPFAKVITKLNDTSIVYTSNMDGEVILKYNYRDSCSLNIKLVGFFPVDTLFWVSEKVKKITLFLREDSTVHLPPVIFNYENEYNSITAKKDISNNSIKLVLYGITPYNFKKMEKTESKYGFKYKILGCQIDGNSADSIKVYNSLMMAELKRKYGQNISKELTY